LRFTDRINVWIESQQDANPSCGDIAVVVERPADVDQTPEVEDGVDVDKTSQSDGQAQLPRLFAVAVKHNAVAGETTRRR